MDEKTLIFTVAASGATILSGWIFKKSPIPNGFIPLLNGVLAIAALKLLMGVPIRESVMSALAIVGAGVSAYEAKKGIAALAPPGGDGK